MELLTLVLLYYLSQNPNFSESVKPLMEKLKGSEEMLRFLKDLSNFSQVFGGTPPPKKESAQSPKESAQATKEPTPNPEKKETSASPTAGIADEFIQKLLDNYFKQQ